mmetsp:Transcript_44404/g.105188  ORF Transcript_44404/g.105188 Transcript_44404/m.105188 type:complete len:215 (-) Transcript_44404:490-1134(-)
MRHVCPFFAECAARKQTSFWRLRVLLKAQPFSGVRLFLADILPHLLPHLMAVSLHVLYGQWSHQEVCQLFIEGTLPSKLCTESPKSEWLETIIHTLGTCKDLCVRVSLLLISTFPSFPFASLLAECTPQVKQRLISSYDTSPSSQESLPTRAESIGRRCFQCFLEKVHIAITHNHMLGLEADLKLLDELRHHLAMLRGEEGESSSTPIRPCFVP